MPIRPVSFLAQAAAQRQQTRENEKQREFQKEQALRDFGMNIGQSIVASLGNFGAQAGADAIRFNREEPYKKLESGVNPVAGAELDTGATAASGVPSTPDLLTKAAMARVATPAKPAQSFTPAPIATPVQQPVVDKALGFAREMQERMPVAKQAMTYAQKAQQPSPVPAAPAPTSRPGGVMAPAKNYVSSVKSAAEARPAPAPAPEPRVSEVATSTSSRGPVDPEATLQARQQIMDIAKRWTSGEPLKFRKRDGTQLTPEEYSFAEAYQMKRDLGAIDMLHKQGLIEAEQANAISMRIKMQAEGDAATTKAENDRQLKIAQAFKYGGEGAKAITGNYDKRGNELSNAPNEGRMTATPGEFPTFQTEPDRAARPRGDGGTGGAPKQSAMFPDATEVFAQGYSTTKTNERGQPLVGEKVLPEDYLATVPGQPQLFKYIFKKDAPAIDEALKAGDWQTAQSLFRGATAEHASQWDASRETVASPADAQKAAEDAEKLKRAEEARTIAAKLAADSRARKAREDAVAKADKARGVVQRKPDAADLFPSARNPKKLQAVADAILAGKPPPSVSGLTPAMLREAMERAKPYLGSVGPFRNRYTKAKQEFIDAGGSEQEWNESVPPPGPSEQSPGQFPPPGEDSPGDESKVDDLFQKIESQPWSAERKRRVFLARAKEAGLA